MAKVNLTIRIAPSGRVDTSQATGGEGYPELAAYVAAQAKAWVFRASDTDTQINIPFTFEVE